MHTCVRERERPEAQVGGGVRHRAEHKLDGVDDLVHEHLGEVKLAMTTVPMATGMCARGLLVGVVYVHHMVALATAAAAYQCRHLARLLLPPCLRMTDCQNRRTQTRRQIEYAKLKIGGRNRKSKRVRK